MGYWEYAKTSLVVQWIKIHLPMQGTQIWTLVPEDSTPHGATKSVSHNYWAHMPRACALQQERLLQWKAQALQWSPKRNMSYWLKKKSNFKTKYTTNILKAIYMFGVGGKAQWFSIHLQRCRPWTRKRQWQPTPVLLPGKSHGRRSLVSCRLWGR